MIPQGYPRRGEGAVIMTNSDAGQGLYFEIVRGMASAFGWSRYQPIAKRIVVLAPDRLAEYEGT